MTKEKKTSEKNSSPSINEIEASGYKIQASGTILGKKGRPLKPRDNGKGYLMVAICSDGKRNERLIHRLVATKFLDNPDSLPEVNHIDEVKSNNDLSNLEWVTHKQNANHGNRTKPVLQLDKDGSFVRRWSSASAAMEEGYCKICICNTCQGNNNTHAGYIWAYDKVKEAA